MCEAARLLGLQMDIQTEARELCKELDIRS
jgi:hypothetical protein